MGREVPYDLEDKCDICGKLGAYDFMGDYICPECADKLDKEKEKMSSWQDIETAPRDGTSILACRDNGCGWEYDVVWYVDNPESYNWATAGATDGWYPEGRLGYWMPLPEPPYKIEN